MTLSFRMFSPEISALVGQAADFVTDTTRDGGFANAVDRFILSEDR